MITPTTHIQAGLSYDDVLLVPKRTRAKSRALVDVSSHLTRSIRLELPILSANVPFCTESPMAIQMARCGGVGFIHRMNTLEEEAREVRRTKAVVVSRDDFPLASVDANGRLLVGAGVGVTGDFEERAAAVVEAGVDLLVIDIAHGHADYALEAIELFKGRYPQVQIVAGNVATAEGTRDLIEAGADTVKVGIGPGGICTTRLVAGAGVPQLTAIVNCVAEARKTRTPIIADGGIRHPGDITKALAAGASTVMLGSGLAGTDESAAHLVEKDGQKYKITTGFVTLGVKLMLEQRRRGVVTEDELRSYVPEGVEATYDYAGPLEDVLLRFGGGLRSGMSYSGAMNVHELWEKAEFIQVLAGGRAENGPHATHGREPVHPDYRKIFTQAQTTQEADSRGTAPSGGERVS